MAVDLVSEKRPKRRPTFSKMLVSFIPSAASRRAPVQRLADGYDASLPDVRGDATWRARQKGTNLVRLAESDIDDEVVAEAELEVPESTDMVSINTVEILFNLDRSALLV